MLPSNRTREYWLAGAAALVAVGVMAYALHFDWLDERRLENGTVSASLGQHASAPELRATEPSGTRSGISAPGRKGEPAPPLASAETTLAALRELWPTDPETALRLAELGEERFSDSPERAAECAWIAVRALRKLHQDERAREKARQLIADYPGTGWAMDVQRHIFGGPPS